jgi:hypothetical protein
MNDILNNRVNNLNSFGKTTDANNPINSVIVTNQHTPNNYYYYVQSYGYQDMYHNGNLVQFAIPYYLDNDNSTVHLRSKHNSKFSDWYELANLESNQTFKAKKSFDKGLNINDYTFSTINDNLFISYNEDTIVKINNDNLLINKNLCLNSYNTLLTKGSNNSLRIQTDKGFLDIGAQDDKNCNIYTDRSIFRFNKSLQVANLERDYSLIVSSTQGNGLQINTSTTKSEDNVLSVNVCGFEKLRIDGEGILYSKSTYNTISEGRELLISSNGQIGYQSALKKYKKNIKGLRFNKKYWELEPITFEYKDTKLEGKQIGLIAEDLERLEFYDFCDYKNGELETIKYNRLSTLNILAIQELKKENDKLKERIAILENKI